MSQTSRLIVKNIPPTLDEASLKKKFDSYGEVTDCQIIFRGEVNRQLAFIGFKEKDSAITAQSKMDQTYIRSSKIKVDFAIEKTAEPKNKKPNAKPVKTLNPEEVDGKRLYLTNLPYTVGESEIASVFGKFGEVENVKIITKNGQSAGYGFLSFKDDNSSIRAIHEMDKKTVFGRSLGVAPCKKINSSQQVEKPQIQEKSSFKKIKKQKMIEKLGDSKNWNSSFLNPNTILERMAEKMGVSKRELLDNEVENPAVMQATCEKEVLDELYDFWRDHNIDTELFKQSKESSIHSSTTILIKNI